MDSMTSLASDPRKGATARLSERSGGTATVQRQYSGTTATAQQRCTNLYHQHQLVTTHAASGALDIATRAAQPRPFHHISCGSCSWRFTEPSTNTCCKLSG